MQLKEAQTYASYEEMGPITFVNGISITAIPSIESDKLKINLISPPKPNMRIYSYGQNYTDEGEQVKLLDEKNNEYYASQLKGFSLPKNEFYFNINSEEKEFLLSVPVIWVIYNSSEAAITINNPKEGMEEIDETIELAGFPIKFNNIERRIDEDNVRINLDLKYDEKANENLMSFEIDFTKMPINGGSWKLNEKTKVIEYLDIPIKDDIKQITLYLHQPEMKKSGPWNFHISLPTRP